MIAWMEDELITIGFLFAACWNREPYHSFRHVPFDHLSVCNIVSLPAGFIGDVEVFVWYELVRLLVYDKIFCFLTLDRLQEIYWSSCCGDDPPLLVTTSL